MIDKLILEQQQMLIEASDQLSEEELFEKLRLEQKKFGEIIRSLMTDREKQIFAQELSEEDLAAVNGGSSACREQFETCHCERQVYRLLHEFPGRLNCASTVESGSWCGESDACFLAAICYIDIKHCDKAHQ